MNIKEMIVVIVRCIGFLAASFVFNSTVSAAPDHITGCLPIVLEDASEFHPPSFEQFAVPTSREKPAPVDTSAPPTAHRFRTELRTQAKQGPDFAGHYTIAGWGCGTSCLQFAIIDSLTGKVYLPPHITSVSAVHVGDLSHSVQRFNALRYRSDSRLLIVLGAIDEDAAQEGIGYYEWNGATLKRIAWFKSDKEWCDSDNAEKQPLPR